MRVAYLNPWTRAAEEQAFATLQAAAARLGHELIHCHTSDDLLAADPDFVLAMSIWQPKLTHHPSYLVLHEPTDHLQHRDRFTNFLVHDGYLTIFPSLRATCHDFLRALARDVPIGEFFPTPSEAECRDPAPPEMMGLAYFGTNWDDGRIEILRELAEAPWLQIYGPPERWGDLTASPAFRGEVAFDGQSVLDIYGQCGAGLCLLSAGHLRDGLVSNRVFEISAAGAVCIAPDVPWLRQEYGDSIVYFTPGRTAAESADAIREQFAWVCENRSQSGAMAREAQRIFKARHSAERMLEQAVDYHAAWQREPEPEPGPISVIVRTGARDLDRLRRCLSSIARQQLRPQEVLIVLHSDAVDVGPALADFADRLCFRILEAFGANRSAALWRGLNGCRAEFVAILDDDDEWFPSHLSDLKQACDRESAAIALSGSIRVTREGAPAAGGHEEHRAIHTFPLDSSDFREPLRATYQFMPNAFLFRRSLLDVPSLVDPGMETAEDSYLVLSLLREAQIAFTFRATAVYYDSFDGSGFRDHPSRESDIAKLARRSFGKRFVRQEPFLGFDDLRAFRPAELVEPRNGAFLERAPLRFSRTDGHGVESARLWCGTSPGASDIFGLEMPAPSLLLEQLPDGAPEELYVRLWSAFTDGSWDWRDYNFHVEAAPKGSKATAAPTLVPPALAAKELSLNEAVLVAPEEGTAIGPGMKLAWSDAPEGARTIIWLGTQPGEADLAGFEVRGTSLTLPALPASNGRLYVRLATVLADGRSATHDYAFEHVVAPADAEAELEAAVLLTPPAETAIGPATEFIRSETPGESRAMIWFGTRPGEADLAGYEMPDTSLTLPALPEGDGPVFVRLWTLFPAGQRRWSDVCYRREPMPAVAAPVVQRVRSELLEPERELRPKARFLRSQGRGVESARLWLGSSRGIADIAGFEMPGVELHCPVLPFPSGIVFVRLWSVFEDGAWEYEDYEFEARDDPAAPPATASGEGATAR